VFEILNENDLCQYYEINDKAAFSLRARRDEQYDYLDREEIQTKILSFQSTELNTVTFMLPQIHCSSCIWLLDNFYKLCEGVTSSSVNFLRKEISIHYHPAETSLRTIVEVLDSIGYRPDIDIQTSKQSTPSDNIGLKIGIAGFAFGNIMLFSFPDYLGLKDETFSTWFGWLNLVLAIPVVTYSGAGYIKAAFVAISKKYIDINIPIAIGILVLFFRSVYEILVLHQSGYIDSLAGLIFFMLIGKWYQNRTYRYLSFERDYRSYFPIAITVVEKDKFIQTPIDKIIKGQQLLIKNNQIIPTDSTLVEEITSIDYSFVTGESQPVTIMEGEKIYAGGRLCGKSAHMVANQDVNNSYLVSLWNKNGDNNKQDRQSARIVTLSKYFTIVVMTIALLSFMIWWYYESIEKAMLVASAILIVACPCALALSIPFIYGNTVRILSNYGIFLKKAELIETISEIDFIAFDKTGTLTTETDKQVFYEGIALSEKERKAVHALTFQSIHPLSIAIEKILRGDKIDLVNNFMETAGKGIYGEVNGLSVKLGSADYIGKKEKFLIDNESSVFLMIDGALKGKYIFKHHYRDCLNNNLNELKAMNISISMISGDNENDSEELTSIFGCDSELFFRQSPDNKLKYIQSKQQGHKVAMIGDGLNDAAALRAADLGIVVTNDTNNFTPASDIIFAGKNFKQLSNFFAFGKSVQKALYGSFVLAIIYNIIGLYFAVTGQLSPVLAAILMPLSSMTVVAYSLISTRLIERKWLVKY
jgi:Cu+-exporting ATPase